jgi:hypothetical protein
LDSLSAVKFKLSFTVFISSIYYISNGIIDKHQIQQMYGKKNGDSPKATATIIISEPKILDLSSLLNRKNGGVSFTPPTAKVFIQI